MKAPIVALKRGRVVFLLLGLAVLAFVIGERRGQPFDEADARIAFYKSRIGGPASYPAYARLGMAYLQKARRTGDPLYRVKAEENLRLSLQFQRNFEALRGLAFLSMEEHRFEAARGYAAEALAALPSDLEAKGILSDAYLALKDRSKAMKLVDEMLATGNSFAGLSRLAVIRFSDRDFPAAIESMQSACDYAERESRLSEDRAWCQSMLEKYIATACGVTQTDDACKQSFSVSSR